MKIQDKDDLFYYIDKLSDSHDRDELLDIIDSSDFLVNTSKDFEGDFEQAIDEVIDYIEGMEE